MKLRKKYIKEYRIWKNMRARCNAPCNKNSSYQAKGIKCCRRWNSFEHFLSDMGECPEGCSLDRIDNNGNYEPNNCRWTDMKTQANNKTNNKYLEYQGRVQTLSQWCEELGLDYYRTKARLNTCGMTVEQAFNKNYYKNDGSKKLNKNIVYKLKGE